MRLSRSEIGNNLDRSETGMDEGLLQARIDIIPDQDSGRILVFQDDQGAHPGRKTSRGLAIMNAVRIVIASEELIEKVSQDKLEFKDVASSMWTDGSGSVLAFRPEVGITLIHPPVENLPRPISLLRGVLVEVN